MQNFFDYKFRRRADIADLTFFCSSYLILFEIRYGMRHKEG